MASPSKLRKMPATDKNDEETTSMADETSSGNTQDITSGCVVLNVGGTKYMTSKETMGSLCLSEEQKKVKDDEGNVFLDGDGDLFRHILNYLRWKRLILPTGFSEIDALDQEASFFRLKELQEEIKRYKENQQDTLWVNVTSSKDPINDERVDPNAIYIPRHREVPETIQITCSVRAYERFKFVLTSFKQEGIFKKEKYCEDSRKGKWLDFGNEKEHIILVCFLSSPQGGFTFFETLRAKGFKHTITVDGFKGYTYPD